MGFLCFARSKIDCTALDIRDQSVTDVTLDASGKLGMFKSKTPQIGPHSWSL